MQKVFDDAKLVQVSPANTNPALSQGVNWSTGEKKRTYKSYFRTATTDAIQGPFAAQYVFNEAKKTKAFIIDDKKTYGSQASRAPSRASSRSSAARSSAPSTSTPTPRTSPRSRPR